MSISSGPLTNPSTDTSSSHNLSPDLSHLKQRVPHLFGSRRPNQRTMTTSLTANTSGSLSHMLMCEDDPDDSLFWHRWTRGRERQRVVYPDFTLAAHRARLFLRFELSLSLATTDKPDERWMRMLDRLLERAYAHFGVGPSDITMQQWLHDDVPNIVKMIATHSAGRNLRNFGDLAERFVETQGAFPDSPHGNFLKALFIMISRGVKVLRTAPAGWSSGASPIDIARFAGTGSVLDPILRALWNDHVSALDMSHAALHDAAPLDESEDPSMEHSTEHENGTDEASSLQQQMNAADPPPSAQQQDHPADRPRSPRQQSEGSGQRPHSPLAPQVKGATTGGDASMSRRKSSHPSHGSLRFDGMSGRRCEPLHIM